MPRLKSLHEKHFAGKPLKIFKVYNDPFGGNEVCIELTFVDGQVEYLGIGPGRPEIVSSALCHEHAQSHEPPVTSRFPQTESQASKDVGFHTAQLNKIFTIKAPSEPFR